MPPDPAEALRARGLRVTPQRRAILGAFTDRPEEHLSAEEVHARAAAVVPELGRGTVYATLAELTELGLLAAFGAAEPVRYETNTARPRPLPLPGLPAAVRRRPRLAARGVARAPGATPSSASRSSPRASAARAATTTRGLEDGVAALETERQVGDAALGLGRLRRARDAARRRSCSPRRRRAWSASPSPSTPTSTSSPRACARGAARGRPATHLEPDRRRDRRLLRRRPGAGRRGRGLGDRTRRRLPSRSPRPAACPYGATRSYDRLGSRRRPIRHSAFALGTNPMPFLFPCHRVTRGQELPRTYVGGLERRAALIALESS